MGNATVRGALRAACVTALLVLGGCGQWSWNPARWFSRPAQPAPAPVEVLTIESASANPAGERFEQSWDGARLVVDVHSPSGIGRATLKPKDGPWPLRLAFRFHTSALE